MTKGITRPGMAFKTGVDLQVLDDLHALRRLEGTIEHLEEIARRRKCGIGAYALQRLFGQTDAPETRAQQSLAQTGVTRGSFGCP